VTRWDPEPVCALWGRGRSTVQETELRFLVCPARSLNAAQNDLFHFTLKVVAIIIINFSLSLARRYFYTKFPKRNGLENPDNTADSMLTHKRYWRREFRQHFWHHRMTSNGIYRRAFADYRQTSSHRNSNLGQSPTVILLFIFISLEYNGRARSSHKNAKPEHKESQKSSQQTKEHKRGQHFIVEKQGRLGSNANSTSERVQCFGGTCRLHLQRWTVSQTRNYAINSARRLILLISYLVYSFRSLLEMSGFLQTVWSYTDMRFNCTYLETKITFSAY
jgi:hypothetical protein